MSEPTDIAKLRAVTDTDAFGHRLPLSEREVVLQAADEIERLRYGQMGNP